MKHKFKSVEFFTVPNGESNNINSPKYRGQNGAVMQMDLIMWAGVVLAAVGFILGLGKLAGPPINGWREASAVSGHMKTIENNYGGSPGYTGLTNASVAVANGGVFSAKYLPGANVINNIFHGEVTISFTTIKTTADTLQYTDASIPSGACKIMASTLADDVDRLSIAATVVKDVGGVLDSAKVTTQCNSAASVTFLIEKIKTN